MNLLELAKQANRPTAGQTILIHGDPGTAKTSLAATIAKVPEITEVNYFGLENGHESLLTAMREGRLTESDAAKIKIFKIVDTPEQPLGYETVFKAMGSQAVNICEEHGRVACEICKKANAPFQEYNLRAQDTTKATIIDTASQLADSIMNHLCKGKPLDYKTGWDETGPQGRNMAGLLSMIQAGKTNWVVVCHSIGINVLKGTTDQIAGGNHTPDDYVEKTYPQVGTQPFSVKVGKYFGHKIYTQVKGLNYSAGSSISYRMNTVIGSRVGWKIETEKEYGLHTLFNKMKEVKIPTQK